MEGAERSIRGRKATLFLVCWVCKTGMVSSCWAFRLAAAAPVRRQPTAINPHGSPPMTRATPACTEVAPARAAPLHARLLERATRGFVVRHGPAFRRVCPPQRTGGGQAVLCGEGQCRVPGSPAPSLMPSLLTRPTKRQAPDLPSPPRRERGTLSAAEQVAVALFPPCRPQGRGGFPQAPPTPLLSGRTDRCAGLSPYRGSSDKSDGASTGPGRPARSSVRAWPRESP